MFIVRFLILFIVKINFTHCEIVETNEQDILSEEERNLRCCSQKLSCCDRSTEPTNFEVRALLLKCPKQQQHRETIGNTINRGPVISSRKRKSTKPIDEIHCHNDEETVKKCQRKIKLTIKIRNSGFTNCKNQYILVDHVFDSVTDRKQKIQNPYVLKIKQYPIMQTYGMVYESMVNFEAKEKVHNKHDHGYSGCNADPTSPSPTCGSVKYRNSTIPYSTGFCCGCDKNSILGSDNMMGSNISLDHLSQLDGMSEQLHSELVNPIQKRGGQDCSNRFNPAGTNPASYHASTHCLEFSDIWYAVFGLEAPKIAHLLSIQIFEKNPDSEGGCNWRDLTQRIPIYIGTDIPHYTDEQNNIAVNYFSARKKESGFSMNHKIHKILIPDTSNIDISKYPELCGGPSEYLVIKDHEVRANGKSCDVAGVGYEAFAKQPNRCNVPQGSCLKNQPKQMWMHDHDAEEKGRKGCYFLKFFGLLPLIPIQVNTTTQNKTLRMYYIENHTSILDIEIRADENIILRPNTLVTITEAYIDSSHPKKTSITVKIFNSGMISGAFAVSLTDCPNTLPASFSNIINSRTVLIAPQRIHTFNLVIDCPLPTNEIQCSLQVTNAEQKVLAIRKLQLRKLDRCFCMWYCRCTCFVRDIGLKCAAFTLHEFHMAGFRGSMPVPVHFIQYSLTDDLIFMMFLCFLIVCFTLFIMGLIKGIIGYFYIPIGEWGFDVLLGLPSQKNSNRYCSSNDMDSSDERQRSIAYPAELCINLMFFIIYPFALIWMTIKKMFFPSMNEKHNFTPYDLYDKCYCKDGNLVQRKSESFEKIDAIH